MKLEENRCGHKRFSSATRVANACYFMGMGEVLRRNWESSRIQWQGSCSGCMGNRGIIGIMNTSAHLGVSEHARRVKRTRAQKKRGRPRGGKSSTHPYDATMAAAGTLTRTKALLLAALKVWELKHRIQDSDN